MNCWHQDSLSGLTDRQGAALSTLFHGEPSSLGGYNDYQSMRTAILGPTAGFVKEAVVHNHRNFYVFKEASRQLSNHLLGRGGVMLRNGSFGHPHHPDILAASLGPHLPDGGESRSHSTVQIQ